LMFVKKQVEAQSLSNWNVKRETSNTSHTIHNTQKNTYQHQRIKYTAKVLLGMNVCECMYISSIKYMYYQEATETVLLGNLDKPCI
jgi:hypothetical protein